MINWIIENKKFLSILAIEQHLKLPSTTLTKAVNGSQSLPPKHNERLNEFVESLIKKARKEEGNDS